MKYLCLRDCFVNSVLWREGKTYELPDKMGKSPKNFKPTDGAEEEIPPTIAAVSAFICPHCRKQLKTKLALAGHMRTHNK